MKIHKEFVRKVRAAQTAEDLIPLVQDAIELEHATIPPYLCGYFTLKRGANDAVSKIIRSVVIEEMLHMTIASNLMIALGGSPVLNAPGFVPKYPGGLPMGIGENLQVHLRKCSIKQITDVFMKIEEPEEPLNIPVATKALAAGAAPEFDTIGAFYMFLAKKLEELGDSVFTGDIAKQVVATKWFSDPEEMFPIIDVKSAVRAINVIIDQGEGTATNPFDDSGAPAHYYRFEEIVKGRKLIHKPGRELPYEFGGELVELDPTQVWDMDDDPQVSKYKEGSASRRVAEQFSYSYTLLLNSLHNAFNGDAVQLDHAMGIMYELRLLAHQVLSTPAEWADPNMTGQKQTGLSFEYRSLNA